MTIVLHWPQVVTLILCAITLISAAICHKQPETQNAWKRLAENVIYIWLLWMGGFFS